ncbi:hypothetical protein E2C01_060724 [Portunus trituberculatus]|uniref:Uncharacterized protein n=1 Tax=Portunus trituberculatus TaxID=210409 RepID=A0A5B7HA92_PORTR|nr:hypothetical protein [Portunus trituberculatus]
MYVHNDLTCSHVNALHRPRDMNVLKSKCCLPTTHDDRIYYHCKGDLRPMSSHPSTQVSLHSLPSSYCPSDGCLQENS